MRTKIILYSSLEIICMALMIITMSCKAMILKSVLDISIISLGIVMLAIVVALVVSVVKNGQKADKF